MTVTQQFDVCYGPIAPGQFFIDRINPNTPVVYKTTGDLNGAVLFCDMWGMRENLGVWSWGVFHSEWGIQIAISRLGCMERVSAGGARHHAESELRRRDDEWRASYDPGREPVKIVRCSCGVGDDAGRTRHAMGCFMRGAD